MCPHYLVSSFKYLGQVLTVSDDDFPAVVANMRKVWWKWGHMSRISFQEGGRLQELQNLLQGGSTSGALIWIRDVGNEPPDQPNHGVFPPQGGPLSVEDATAVQHRGDVLVYKSDGVNDGSRPGVGGDIFPPTPKHYSSIYHDSSNIVDVSGGGTATRRAGG